MTRLSVNLNKVALLRNARGGEMPSLLEASATSLAAGAHGITVHPRPDRRHIRPSDVHDLGAFLADYPSVELNVEGNPFPDFIQLVRAVRPHQCTLVPDSANALTSDHGWDLARDGSRLKPLIAELQQLGIRVALFMDADSHEWPLAREAGADRIELYTAPYADAHTRGQGTTALAAYASAAAQAQSAGLAVNAGHDLNLANLAEFCRLPNILEVSIGHALIADALVLGLTRAVEAYLMALGGGAPNQGRAGAA